MPVFLQGYEEVLKGVAEAGRFRLHGLTSKRAPATSMPCFAERPAERQAHDPPAAAPAGRFCI